MTAPASLAGNGAATQTQATARRNDATMKPMFLAFLATVVLAVLADFGLDRAGFSVQDVTAGPSVRLD